MPTKTTPIVAKEISATETHLVLTAGHDRYEIPWAECSEKLAAANSVERTRAVLSPSGYGIHWPLLDEDLAVESLISERAY